MMAEGKQMKYFKYLLKILKVLIYIIVILLAIIGLWFVIIIWPPMELDSCPSYRHFYDKGPPSMEELLDTNYNKVVTR